MHSDNPQREVMLAKFLAEYTHGKYEVRFFVEGDGLLCLHVQGKIHQILCEKNDLISVPAGTPHWFNMGEAPCFTAIRVFDNQEDWIARFTGDAITDAYPHLPR